MPSPTPTMRSREAGHAAVGECLSAVAAGRQRSRLEQVLGISPLRPAAVRRMERVRLEQETGRQLSRLPADWTVLHSVPVGSAVVPHLAIGPAGVFAVFPQDVRDASVWISAELLSVDGVSSDASAEADAAVSLVEDRLGPVLGRGIEVVPVVAFPEPRQLVVRAAAERVRVLAAADVVPWLKSLPEVCSALIVDRLADAAELPATWGAAAGESGQQRLRFQRLQADLRLADLRWRRTVRVLVTASGIVVAGSATALALLVGALLPS
jgi:hypothetical protein